jgi:hypothetical protein
VELVDERAERHREQTGERFLRVYRAHGGMNGSPPSTFACPPTGRYATATRGLLPPAARLNGVFRRHDDRTAGRNLLDDSVQRGSRRPVDDEEDLLAGQLVRHGVRV